MFDSDDLIAYLANPNSSFVNDLHDILLKLPYHIIVSTTTSNDSSMIKYSNRNDGIIGQNLHEKYIANV